MKDGWRLAMVGLLGAISVLAWAPYAWWPVFLPVYGGLGLVLKQAGRPLAVAGLSLVFGMAQHLTGHVWVFDGLSGMTGLSTGLAAMSTLAFAVYLSLFAAVAAFLWARIQKKGQTACPAAPWRALLSLAAFLTLGDWARSLFFNGFSSLSPGYAWIDTPLAGYLPLLGVYGIGFVAYVFSFTSMLALIGMHQARYRPAVLSIAGLGMVTGIGGWCGSIQWVAADAGGLSYRLLQTNVRQASKYDPRLISREVVRVADLVASSPARLVVTPETAFPQMFHQLSNGLLEQLRVFSAATGSHLFIGIITAAADGDGHNSIVHIAPGVARLSFFNKIRLMPFGEYSPHGLGWFARQLHIPFKDLLPGVERQSPFAVDGIGVGVLICQEDQTSDLSRHWPHAAGVLISPSNLAWFEHGLAMFQDFQILRARAMEVGRPILRVANTGITAHVDHRGRVVRQLPIEEAGVLEGTVEPVSGLTPFTFYGDYLVVAGCLFLIVGLAMCPQRRAANSATRPCHCFGSGMRQSRLAQHRICGKCLPDRRAQSSGAPPRFSEND